MTIKERFNAADNDEYLEFERIPETERRHPQRDLCAFLYLHEKLGGEHKMIVEAQRSVIFLRYTEDELEKLTADDVIYLTRCGVLMHEEFLQMFV